ncbi:hypothetical protein [Mucilaginibacter sp. SP1R1]|uniref:hypothetical protein n=1 Tax=Mucilaginibacter sp. SP1R1 TaxID=2723091 RepID=UPI00160C4BE6|nr:hypothetical protein [Mucilaginibacter sp. SP1R1]MBB6148373.1 hypothetical protein [Mucilaginibacter sp. SP1R1]
MRKYSPLITENQYWPADNEALVKTEAGLEVKLTEQVPGKDAFVLKIEGAI